MIRVRLPKLLLLVFLCCCGVLTFGQNEREGVDFFSARNGLPHSSVLSLLQDSRGYLWIGTYNGLCRYDGNEFRQFPIRFSEKESGWIRTIDLLREDAEGNIWTAVRGGVLARLNWKTGTWTRFFVEATVTDMVQDKDGSFWLGTQTGQLFHLKNDTLRKVTGFPFYLHQVVLANNGDLYATANGLYRVDKSTGRTRLVKSFGTEIDRVVLWNDRVFSFYLNGQTGVSHLGEPDDFVNLGNLRINLSKHAWGKTAGGNALFESTGSILEFDSAAHEVGRVNLSGKRMIPEGEAFNALIADKSGILWVGTNSGLYKIDRRKMRFSNYTLGGPPGLQVRHNYIRALASAGNELWVGTREGEIGRLEIDPTTRDILQAEWYPLADEAGRLDHEYITNDITVLPDGSIWAGGREGIYRFDPAAKCFRKTPLGGAESGTLIDVWALEYNGAGSLVIGTINRGSYIYNLRNNSLKPLLLNNRPLESMVWSACWDTAGRMTVGTSDGVFTVNREGILTPGINGEDQLVGGRDIWNILPRGDDYWLGSTLEGLTRLTISTGIVERYGSGSGLPENVVSTITADASGAVWVGSINGLVKLNEEGLEPWWFTEDDGLVSSDFNFKASVLMQNGAIFLGTKVGLISFRPERIISKRLEPIPVTITKVEVKGVEHELGNTPLRLRHDQNFLSFKLAILDYSFSNKHRYRFRLQGYEDNWRDADNKNPYAVYTNLPPGKYTLQMLGAADGVTWTPAPVELALEIIPAFWQRTTFWVAILLVLIAAAIAAVRYRVKQLIYREREKAQVEREMATLEINALRAQMNPHFIFNAITSIQHYILNRNIEMANEYLTRFARLMRQFLDSSRSNYTMLQEEVKQLELYLSLEHMRFEGKFEYEVRVENNLSLQETLVPSMLVQPFVENAILHGLLPLESKGQLEVIFRLSETGQLMCVIDDNGVGRKTAEENRNKNSPLHRSHGMRIVEERLKKLMEVDGTDVTIRITDKETPNGLSAGTRVEIHFVKPSK